MLREWQRALAQYRGRRPRRLPWDRYQPIIDAVLQQLRACRTEDELHRRYRMGNFWCLQIARRLYPNDTEMWDLHLSADVAYGLRYEELTGETVEADEEDDG